MSFDFYIIPQSNICVNNKIQNIVFILVIFFDNRNILCFGFSDIAAALFPLYTPVRKDHKGQRTKTFTEVLTLTDSFSKKVAYEKNIEKVTRKRVRYPQNLSKASAIPNCEGVNHGEVLLG